MAGYTEPLQKRASSGLDQKKAITEAALSESEDVGTVGSSRQIGYPRIDTGIEDKVAQDQ
jgi:hypothetical protein